MMEILLTLAPLLPKTEAELDKVQRWTNFQTSSGSRSQTTLAHLASIQIPAIVILETERQHNWRFFEADLVLGALALHDLGEVSYSDKNELEAFKALIQTLPESVQPALLDRFLLQFVGKDTTFDDAIQARLKWLGQSYNLEATLFQVIERFDYLLYALNEYIQRGNLRILVHTLRRSHVKLKAWAQKLPGFATIYNAETIK